MSKSKDKTENINSIHHPNDALFKVFMSDPIMANDLFAMVLPKAIYQRMNSATLLLCPQTFVDNKLKHKHLDVLYQTEFDHEIGYIYILTEQQTEPDATMPFRMMHYIMRIIEHHQKQFKTQQFPVIYPLIYYVGKKPYKFSTDFYDGFGDHKDLAKSILTNPFQVVNVVANTEEEQNAHPLAGALSKMYQMVFVRDLMAKLPELKAYMKYMDSHGYSGFLISMVEFILNKAEQAGQGKGEAVVEAITQMVTVETGEKIMTLAQQMKQEARQEGRQEQQYMIAKKLLIKGIVEDIIAETTELSLEEIKKLKKELGPTKH